MLPRKYRLSKSADFQKVLKKGKVIRGTYMGLAFYNTGESAQPRVGIIVSNKISKKATERNRIKRSMREAAGDEIEKFKQGDLLVFLAKKSIVYKDRESIIKEAGELLGKVRER